MNGKPLPPSEKRLRDAREKGDVPRSEPLIAWLVLAFCVEVVFACFDSAWRALLEIMQTTFTLLGEAPTLSGLARSAWLAARFLAGALAIVTATAAIAAIIGTWACAGLHFAPKALAPSLKRLHPLNHLKQMFSTKHLSSIAIALATAWLIGLVGYAALVHRLPLFTAMVQWQSVEHGWVAGIDTLHSLLRLLLAVLIAPAIVSKLTVKMQHLRKLRMSHREAREELKQTTGDPLMRARQRAALYEMASAPPPSPNITAGCALVTNPEHLAVMLYYEGDERAAPVILDKGADEAAWRMTDAAQSQSVPVFRFRKLAHRLYEHGQAHSIIPPDCYRAVAIVYRLVEEIQTLGACPVEPIDIDDAFFDA